MTLDTMSAKPLSDILAECTLVEQKIHSGNDGTVHSIELKYIPKTESGDTGKSNVPIFGGEF